MTKQKFAIQKIEGYVSNDWYEQNYLRYRAGSRLDNDLQATKLKVDKIKMLNDVLEDYSSTNNDETNWFWPILYNNCPESYLTENFWKSLWLKILNVLNDYSDRKIPRVVITILRKFNWRFRQYSNYCTQNDLLEPIIGQFDPSVLSNSVKTAITQSFNEIIAIIKNKFETLPKFYRPNEYGVWNNTLSPEWPKFGYNSHRRITVTPLVENSNVMKYGAELEGVMSNSDYQNACTEMSKTPFEGGFILDKRNLIMGTEDGSLPRDTGVEWVFAPFSIAKGKEFWKKVEEILEKHHFKRTCNDFCWGLHIHLDADKFKNKSVIESFINKVYSYPAFELYTFFKRNANTYCSWDIDSVRYYEENWKELPGQFTKDNKQLGYLEKSFKLRCSRYNLINTTNIKWIDSNSDNEIEKGTVEVRGFYAVVKIIDAVNIIKNKFLEGVIQCA